MSLQREQQRFHEFIRGRGMRVTAERRALLEEIFSHHRHLDAEDLYGALRDRGIPISRATVYRNLELLARAGMVRKHRLGQGRYLFEHLHAGQEHDHLVCTSCDRVVEFQSPGIAALQVEICRAHGFEPRRHGLEIHGLCRECAAKARREQEGGAGAPLSPREGGRGVGGEGGRSSA